MDILNLFFRRRPAVSLSGLRGSLAVKYQRFRNLLTHNQRALSLLSDMEYAYYTGKPFTLAWAGARYEEFAEAVFGLVHALQSISGGAYEGLVDRSYAIDGKLADSFKIPYRYSTHDIVLPLRNGTDLMQGMLGAKAANLAVAGNEMGLPVPDGFVVTSYAFERFMEENDLFSVVEQAFACLSGESHDELDKLSIRLREAIMAADVPGTIREAILQAYADLERRTIGGVRISMRSSAVGEDSDASFAGQFTSVLNVTRENIIDAYKTVVASAFSPRAISYRLLYGLDTRETPMCVLGIVMVDARTSGVGYTVDPTATDSGLMRINALWGLGEQLVGGSVSPDSFLIDRSAMTVVRKDIVMKDRRLAALPEGGTQLEEVTEGERASPSLDDASAIILARYALRLEERFGRPQDIEWAVDGEGKLFILQSRPLRLPDRKTEEGLPDEQNVALPILLSAGKTASPGVAIGKAFVVSGEKDLSAIPDDAVIVAKVASPDLARVINGVRGIITDLGSVTSHLSSVAREFGVPMIVDTGNATAILKDGDVITLSATSATVYQGIVESMRKGARTRINHFVDSPVHKRMRSALDLISPLNLIDPDSPFFSPDGCETFHDIIRFCHERSMVEMSGIGKKAEEGGSIRLETTLPLVIHLVDLGGGLREGLAGKTAVAGDLLSTPMKAIWRGFNHPGITWSGTINFDMKKMATLFAVAATSEFGELPGGTSYAIFSKEFLNFNGKFGYHFATLDALCTENSDQNYISLQFSGGAGTYYGKSLRIQFLGAVLNRLGFRVNIKGDLLEAALKGYDLASLEEKLDQTGRLLASSRLLDMVLSSQTDVAYLTERFFNEDYDYLTGREEGQPEHFYVHGGHWNRMSEGRYGLLLQDGSKEGFTISSGIAGLMGRIAGPSLQDFLDNLGAYYYFPMAIAKDSEIADGTIMGRVKSTGGNIDRAAGLAFGIRNTGNYFAFRINALEDNVILFEFVNGKRFERMNVSRKIETDRWYMLKIVVRGGEIEGYIDKERVLNYTASEPVSGHVGLWTKADSVSYFDTLVIDSGGRKRIIEH